jgi:hypothetical protein
VILAIIDLMMTGSTDPRVESRTRSRDPIGFKRRAVGVDFFTRRLTVGALEHGTHFITCGSLEDLAGGGNSRLRFGNNAWA